MFKYDGNWDWVAKKKLDSGSTIEMRFEVRVIDTNCFDTFYVGVVLGAYRKRKQKTNPDFFYRTTNSAGLEAAVWATEALLEFPEYLFSQQSHQFLMADKIVYEIHWSDTRRRDVYTKWLGRYGFYQDSYPGFKILTRTFHRTCSESQDMLY